MRINPELLVFSLPAEEIEQAFVQAANAAGYFGLDVYSFVWDLGKYEPTEEQKQNFKAAEQMGYNAGKVISDLVSRAIAGREAGGSSGLH